LTIQIGKLRKWTPPGETKEVIYFSAIKGFHYQSLKDLFNNVEADLPKFLSEKEQNNIFYTVAHHLEGQRTFKSWQAQDIVPFDLDGIDLDRKEDYLQVVADACGFDLQKCAVVFSGNGIHILVQVPRFTDTEFIKDAKLGYKQLVERIKVACDEHALPYTDVKKGPCDSTAWDYARILRVPFTKNVKVNDDGSEKIKHCELFLNNLVEQPWSVPKVDKIKSDKFLAKGAFPNPDRVHIVSECNFFKWLAECPDEVHEPHAYAMLSIAGHFDDDGTVAKNLWEKFSSPSINSKNLEEFTEQALTASGPRTCQGIDEVWGNCKECPHYNKVTSPIMLKGDDFIGTQYMGFTTRSVSGKSFVRHYDDLVKFFRNEHHYKHIPETSDIYIYDKTHYVPFHPARVKKYAQDNFTKPVKETERMEYLKCVEANDYTPIQWLEKKPTGKINFQNGILDIETGKLEEHSPEHNFTTCLPFSYDPDAVCPTWDQFIKDVTIDRVDLANILHEFMGFCAYGGEYRYHKALVLSGSGKNGKSTFIDVLTSIMGEENTSAVPLTSLSKDVFAMADMHGKLINVSEEEPPSCFKETGVFKNLTGNNYVRAQKKFKSPFKMLSRAKIVISYNELPFISDTSTGMRRRLLIVPFDLNLENNPSKVNTNIKDDLSSELPGIFNRALEGWKRLEKQRGFSESESVKAAVKEIIEGSSSFYLWLNECVDETNNHNDVVKTSDAFNSYVNFMTDNNERNSMGRRKFTQELKNRGYAQSVILQSGKSIRGFRGAKLIEQGTVNHGF